MKDILSTELEDNVWMENFRQESLKDNFHLLEHKLSRIRRETFCLWNSALKVQTNVEVSLREENQAGMLALS